jgi:hypothetical protein
MWNLIPYPDFRRLIKNYDDIDFRKFDVSTYRQSETNVITQAIFNSLVKTYYVHYHQNAEYESLTRVAIDIFSNNIIKYTEDAIKRRLDRMERCDGRPIFIFDTRNRKRYNGVYTERDIVDFINLRTPYMKILLVSYPEFKHYPEKKGNTNIVYYEDRLPSLPPDTIHMATVVYNKFKDIINDEA